MRMEMVPTSGLTESDSDKNVYSSGHPQHVPNWEGWAGCTKQDPRETLDGVREFGECVW